MRNDKAIATLEEIKQHIEYIVKFEKTAFPGFYYSELENVRAALSNAIILFMRAGGILQIKSGDEIIELTVIADNLKKSILDNNQARK